MVNNHIELQKQMSTAVERISKQVKLLSDRVGMLTEELEASSKLNQLTLKTALLSLQAAGQQADNPATFFDHIYDSLSELLQSMNGRTASEVLKQLETKIANNDYIDFNKPIHGIGNPNI